MDDNYTYGKLESSGRDVTVIKAENSEISVEVNGENCMDKLKYMEIWRDL